DGSQDRSFHGVLSGSISTECDGGPVSRPGLKAADVIVVADVTAVGVTAALQPDRAASGAEENCRERPGDVVRLGRRRGCRSAEHAPTRANCGAALSVNSEGSIVSLQVEYFIRQSGADIASQLADVGKVLGKLRDH